MQKPLKRFLIFRCSRYYPSGGMDDFVAHASTYEAAKAYVDKEMDIYESWHVFDTETNHYHQRHSDDGSWEVMSLSNILFDPIKELD